MGEGEAFEEGEVLDEDEVLRGEALDEGEALGEGEAFGEDEDEEEDLDEEVLDEGEAFGEGEAFAEGEDSDWFDWPRAAPIAMPIAITAFTQHARARDRIQPGPGRRLRAFCEYIRDNTRWNRWNCQTGMPQYSALKTTAATMAAENPIQ